MKNLNIAITKAQLVSFDVKLKKGKPVVNATIALLTEGGKPITTYSVYTDGWDDETKFDLPLEAMPLIGDLAKILEGVIVRHCRDGQLALPAPKPDDIALTPKPNDLVVIEDIPAANDSIIGLGGLAKPA